jgi:hypothetical protein
MEGGRTIQERHDRHIEQFYAEKDHAVLASQSTYSLVLTSMPFWP